MKDIRLLVFYEWLCDEYDDNYSNDYLVTSILGNVKDKFEELECDKLAYELDK